MNYEIIILACLYIFSIFSYGIAQLCYTIREDGKYIEAGENDNLIIQKLVNNPNAVGVFGYSFLDQNTDSVKGATVDGIQPTFESIASGDYTVSRSLFFYVKKDHVGRHDLF